MKAMIVIQMINMFCGQNIKCREVMTMCVFSEPYSKNVNLDRNFRICKDFYNGKYDLVKIKGVDTK